MADNDERDSTEESDAASADVPPRQDASSGPRPGGSHVVGAPRIGDGEPDGLSEDEDPKELVAVGASTVARAGSEDAGVVARNRQKKDKATARQKQVADKAPRTGPVTFLRESVSELQKVVYPTGQQLVNYFVVVLIFVLFIIAIVSLLDLAFGKVILAVFG